MPSPRAHRNGVAERSMSFHGRDYAAAETLRRPRTVPDLMSAVRNGGVTSTPLQQPAAEVVFVRPKLTKVLLNVTVQGSVGAVQVLISAELTVRDLISAAVKQYVKEGRRPVLSSSCADQFDLHYSQFSLESLDREEKIAALGSRNFFLCKRRAVAAAVADGGSHGGVQASSCLKQAEKAAKLVSPCPWLKFMNFLF